MEPWPFGSGGRCGPAFAAAMASMRLDLAAWGVRGCIERWTASGALNPAVARVLTDADLDAMQRAFDGSTR